MTTSPSSLTTCAAVMRATSKSGCAVTSVKLGPYTRIAFMAPQYPGDKTESTWPPGIFTFRDKPCYSRPMTDYTFRTFDGAVLGTDTAEMFAYPMGDATVRGF